jgi:predicted ATPase
VTNDQFENTIRVRVTLDGSDKPQIPLAALSDGTLKWMSLVTAIFTNDSILAIEEPENFIHPSIQREVVKISRDQTQNHSFLIMSSHSETILNSAEPEEVVVVYIKNGRTYARRVSNPQKLRKLIIESGFGLGFHYLSGGLEDA